MTEHRPLRQRILTGLGYALAALVLLAVFGLYTDPDFMILMADQIWACF
ncbi:hypothetical protein N0K08_01405 [Acidovorax sp. Be4]|uniref:Uncharacterized protein n=1 Tax=Acidovorax bellezanensis TaxID=2976702 RepID=A0ABT2PFZ1_9BURK|nr:hypothetical protein [Acidovorax sp. Be4]MCT9809280.1 hypothetical protein [Acidovorax sp. Be4]